MEKNKSNKNNTANEIYYHIKHMILSGEIHCGQRIPEETIAQMFGVSRTPIRETLRQLEIYGLIYIKPRSYAEVIKLSDEEISQIAIVRANLECFAVQILAARISEENKIALEDREKACWTAFEEGDVAEVFEKDSLLHLEIAKRTKNQYLYDILERLDSKVQLYRISKCLNYGKLKTDISQHKAIINAINSGDVVMSAKLMEKHILGSMIGKTIPGGGEV